MMLQENIVSINELADLLGHSSPIITPEHYSSIIEPRNIALGTDFSLFRHKTDTVHNDCVDEALQIGFNSS